MNKYYTIFGCPSNALANCWYTTILYYSMFMNAEEIFLLEQLRPFFYYFNTLWNMIQRCCYKTVDFATAASQNGV